MASSTVNGNCISPRTRKGHWPSKETFQEKYNEFLGGRARRREKQMQKKLPCDACGKPCKNTRGVAQHKASGGCAKYNTERQTIKDQISPVKYK
jgi:hypothetical protein